MVQLTFHLNRQRKSFQQFRPRSPKSGCNDTARAVFIFTRIGFPFTRNQWATDSFPAPSCKKKEKAVSKLFGFMWTGLNVETSHRTAARLVAFQMLFRPVFQCSQTAKTVRQF